jgi:hypothetical protein
MLRIDSNLWPDISPTIVMFSVGKILSRLWRSCLQLYWYCVRKAPISGLILPLLRKLWNHFERKKGDSDFVITLNKTCVSQRSLVIPPLWCKYTVKSKFKNDYVKISSTCICLSTCTCNYWKNLRTFGIYSMNRRIDEQEVSIGFAQKWIPPCVLPKQNVLKFQASAMSGCQGNCYKNLLYTLQIDATINWKLIII